MLERIREKWLGKVLPALGPDWWPAHGPDWGPAPRLPPRPAPRSGSNPVPAVTIAELTALNFLASPCCDHVSLCDGACRDAWPETVTPRSSEPYKRDISR